MIPVVALVGRPNVGKSTLFNRITRSRDAIVANIPGLTRDRHYARTQWEGQAFLVVDTGGFEPVVDTGIVAEMAKQTKQAIAESDVVVFLTDARTGLAPQDQQIAAYLRKTGKTVVLAVNKAEGLPPTALAEFHELGLGQPLAVSAAHGSGVGLLLDAIVEHLRPPVPEGAPSELEHEHEHEPVAAAESAEFEPAPQQRVIKLAIVGRPNVGKSTLINALVGEERVIAFDQPGTTRDAIEVPFERDGVAYTLIDTAGLRRKGKVFETIEKFSVLKTLQAIESANVVVLLLDASEGVSDQDAHIAGFAVESGRAVVVAANKWDKVDAYQRQQFTNSLHERLPFLSFARQHEISALSRKGLGALLKSVNEAFKAAFAKLSTPRLTRALQEAVAFQQPPRAGTVRPKLRYAHQGGQNPPVIVIHGNALDRVPNSYTRYLESRFSKVFKLSGTPLRVEYRSSHNPYQSER
ncbi:ribosome biogenesis GTPase Der [Thiomonas sp. FB-Cd]|uniref:ribosome biogenesis GTPase Der n=1 Tax=Thiomonas sp. FB-Cd TaxID=1158292 RepID=UPI0004DFC38E|nr:ribosome biogenesis GTPase Der [Thiomonas sp. FB-Cd]